MLNLWKPQPKRAGIVRRLPPVVPGVPITKYTTHELAVRVARKAGTPKLDPGIAWARLMRLSNRPNKDAARDAVLSLFGTEQFKTLSILTLPASEWRFETALLEMREGAKRMETRGPGVTRIQSIERDEAVYRAAVHNIPRLTGKNSDGRPYRVRVYDAPSYATACVNSAKIERFFRCTFEDYATAPREYHQGSRVFDGAWLDFNGKLSPSRLSAIELFWQRQVRSVAVVTLFNGRMCDWIMGRIKHHGGIEHMLAASLPGSIMESVLHYGDTSAPMVQIVLRRESGVPMFATPFPEQESA